jgi:hypothetical protein
MLASGVNVAIDSKHKSQPIGSLGSDRSVPLWLVAGVPSRRKHIMATVKDILAVKGSHILSIGPEASVLDAAG